MARAPELARSRGTRAGLEALLGFPPPPLLLAGTPPRFRITDATADRGFATVGGGTCRGSTLPALLGGRTWWSGELGSSAVLGCMRLPCAGEVDDGVLDLVGRVRVDVAASAEERRAWELLASALIEEMVPVTARVQLRWVSAQALHGARLDGSFVPQGPPAPHLGSDAVTGVARLPERGSRIMTDWSRHRHALAMMTWRCIHG
ncbi:MAG: hypothetical protein U1E63_15935 [Burkholderiales bacterium]